MPIYQEILKKVTTIEKKLAVNNLMNSVDEDKDDIDFESSEMDIAEPTGKTKKSGKKGAKKANGN